MARLNSISKNTLIRDLPDGDKMRLALQAAREPYRDPTTAARCHGIANEHSVRQTWRREKKRSERRMKLAGGAGLNKILSPDQHQALLQYAADHATGGGMGSTKQMMFSCAMWLRVQEGRKVCSNLEVVPKMAQNNPRTSYNQDETDCEAPRRYICIPRTTSSNGSRKNTDRRSNTPE
ncbi:hypothetical protein V8E54_011208 [Elaphomyces granulatus]